MHVREPTESVASSSGRHRRTTTAFAVLVVLVVGFLSVGCIQSTQTIAAGTSATNLPTENTWPGAENPPYVCCWGSDGQYVTFSFTTGAGSTNLALRYSAGDGSASRKLILDGSVWMDDAPFAATADWATWSTSTFNTTLTSGTHQLEVLFDSAAGSHQYMNLDNLEVTPVSTSAPPGVTVALGYADTSAGISPWSGSPNTMFIGSSPQCCLTSGPDNGNPGYDAGAVEVVNNGSSPVQLDAITVDFGGGSNPSSFDLWGGGTPDRLPQTVPVGGRVIVTMTSGFNFDTSDLFSEVCNPNSSVILVVHVTLNGKTINYFDDHQILNTDGNDVITCPGAKTEQHAFTVVSPGHQAAAAPQNDVLPSVRGVAITDRVLSGFMGAWNASPPPTLAMQWTRCTDTGTDCVAISGATTPTYRPTATDVGSRLRLQVTASNPSGTSVVSSAPSAVIKTGPTVAQFGDTSTGSDSLLVNSATELGSIFTASADGTTANFEFYARGGGNSQDFTPKIYEVVDGQPGTLLATGATVTVAKGSKGNWRVSKLSGLHLTAGTQYYLALAPSGVFNGTYVGAEKTGEMAFFVDYTP